MREFRLTWRGTRTREDKEDPRSGGRTASPSLESSDARLLGRTRQAEFRIDCEEDRSLRAVLVGMLREGDR